MAVTGQDLYAVHYEQMDRFWGRMGWEGDPPAWEELSHFLQETWNDKADDVNRKDAE